MKQIGFTLFTIILVTLAGTPATQSTTAGHDTCRSIEEGAFDCERARLSALPGNQTFADGTTHLLDVTEGGTDAIVVRRNASSAAPVDEDAPHLAGVEEGGFDVERTHAADIEARCGSARIANC